MLTDLIDALEKSFPVNDLTEVESERLLRDCMGLFVENRVRLRL